MTTTELLDSIENWARTRNIIDGSSLQAQYIKLAEEAGEIAVEIKNFHTMLKANGDSILPNDDNKHKFFDMLIDGLGDVVVVATNMAAIGGFRLDERSFDQSGMKSLHNGMNIGNLLLLSNDMMCVLGDIANVVSRKKSFTTPPDYSYCNPTILDKLVEIAATIANEIGVSLDYCLEQSYNEIKDRKGLLIDGMFVKESDLTDELRQTYKEQLDKQS